MTTDGRTISGITSLDHSYIPTDPVALAAAIPGGMAAGVAHIRSRLGWVYVPASQIQNVISVHSGAQT